MRATLSFIKTKIIANENDKIGVVLYGVAKEGGAVANENPLNFKNIHVLYSLDIPDASLIKKLETKITTMQSDHGFFNEGDALVVAKDDHSQINSSAIAGSSIA